MAEAIKLKTQIDIKQSEVNLATLGKKILNTSESLKRMKARMEELKGAKIPTSEYADIQKYVEKTTFELDKLIAKQQSMARSGDTTSKAFEKIDARIEEMGADIRSAEAEMEHLVATGEAFTPGADSDEFKRLAQDIPIAEQQMELLNLKMEQATQKHEELSKSVDDVGDSYTGLKNKVEELSSGSMEKISEASRENTKEVKRFGNEARKQMNSVTSATKKSGNAFTSFGKRIKGILVSMLVFDVIRKGIRAVIDGIKEGFGNLMEQNSAFKSQIDSLQGSFLTLKNALASAFLPLVQIAIPYIQKVADWLTHIIDLAGQFISALTGHTTYTRAIKQTGVATKDTSKATDKATKSTKNNTKAVKESQKALEGYLSPIDELNKLQKEQEDFDFSTPEIEQPKIDTPNGGGVGAMFEEVPIDNKVLEWLERIKDMFDEIKKKLEPIIAYAKELANIFKQGFLDGLGDWEPRLENIKESLKSIKESLADIFTDPKVLASADAFVKSFTYMLGSLVGAVASIGLTIAQNLVGGLADYLENNKDRIKNHLISMFDIKTEINYLLADFFQAFAYVFEAFGQENGQKLTSNIIGIFTDAFMGAQEVVAKLVRDTIKIITQPFVDNKEAFRTAIDGFLGVLATVTGTVKTAVDETIDKINEVYDEHLAPFFQSIADGLSEITGLFLDFVNGNLIPMLQSWAESFDTLWNEHLQPFVDSFLEMFGAVVDLMKVLWEEQTKPFIEWVVANVLPILIPILDELWNKFVETVGQVADYLNLIVETFTNVVQFITAIIRGDWSTAWDEAKQIGQNFVDYYKQMLEVFKSWLNNHFGATFEMIKKLFESFGDNLKKFMDGLSSTVQKIVQTMTDGIHKFISDGLSKAKETWFKKWDEFKEKIQKVWDSMCEIVSKAVDKIMEFIEKIKGAISEAKASLEDLKSSAGGSSTFKLGGILGGGALGGLGGFTMPSLKLPKYATGQVIPTTMAQHLAILGDNKKETEVVSPLSTIKQALKEAQAEMGGNQTITVPLIVDGRTLTQIVIENGKVMQMSTGTNVFALEG